MTEVIETTGPGAHEAYRPAIEAERAALAAGQARAADPLVQCMWAWVQNLPTVDRRHILSALISRLTGASGDRAELARAALDEFTRARPNDEITQGNYEKYRLSEGASFWLPSATAIGNWFGGWSAAMDGLGYAPAPNVLAARQLALGPEATRHEMVRAAKECADALGRDKFGWREYRAWAEAALKDPESTLLRVIISRPTVCKHFGSLAALRASAGLLVDGEVLNARRDWDPEEARYALDEAREHLLKGRPTQQRYQDWREDRLAAAQSEGRFLELPSASVISRLLGGGSWIDALVAEGVLTEAQGCIRARGRGKRAPLGFVADSLLAGVDQHGVKVNEPTWTAWREQERRAGRAEPPSQTVIGHRFGWLPAKQAAAACLADGSGREGLVRRLRELDRDPEQPCR